METFVPAVAMLTLIKKVLDFLKYLTNQDWNGALTQVCVWVAGIAVVWLYAQTDWAEGISFAGLVLSSMNFASLVALGIGLGSSASVATDFIKARDNTDSAAMPPLIK